MTQACEARFATPRTPGRKTHGGRIAAVAEAIGKPLMPWQRQVVDVIGEVDDDTGRLAYREYRVTVPRQSGKTTLILPKLVYRCLSAPRQRVVYTAQNRIMARAKWEQEHVALLRESPVFGPEGDLFRVRLQSGSERIEWKSTGSLHGIDAVKADSGHGNTLDEGIIDEAFSRPDWAVEQAMRPGMLTRANAQLGILSTAGKSELESPYLWEKVQDGRARAEAGQNRGIAYFEWSAGDDVDVHDPDEWWRWMPALGHTIGLEALEADHDALANKPGEWDRAYGNRWPNGRTVIQAIPGEAWEACKREDAQIVYRLFWAVEVSEDRATAAIAVAGHTADGREIVDVIATGNGTGWVVPMLVKLRAAHGYENDTVAIDASGPAATLVADLESQDVEDGPFIVKRLATRDKAEACGALYDAAIHVDEWGHADRLVHRGQDELDRALAAADKQRIGDMWYWSRRSSLDDISPLNAVTFARWLMSISDDGDYRALSA